MLHFSGCNYAENMHERNARSIYVFSNLTVEPKEGLDSGKIEPPSNRGHLSFSSDKSTSYSTIIQEGDTEQAFDGDQSIAQLMEALCHSQTRAREAEELLHLDTQIKNKHNPVSTRFLKALPSTPFEHKKPLNRKRKFVNDKQEKIGKAKSDVSTTYDVAFSLGLSLVGAGLLLGWTVGWMLPSL
ncbi:hypothetical protein QL285_091154 [Trifolium repens]|nr:hypothetical protein QL285_091154 [Trifolium repens]